MSKLKNDQCFSIRLFVDFIRRKSQRIIFFRQDEFGPPPFNIADGPISLHFGRLFVLEVPANK